MEAKPGVGQALLAAANKIRSNLEEANAVAKVTHNVEQQMQVGVLKWLNNGLYGLAAMGGTQNPQVKSSSIPACGGVAPYSAEQKISNKPAKPAEPLAADVGRVINGDISEKTVGALNIGVFALTFGDGSVVTNTRFQSLKLNIYGEGEALGFTDIAVNPFYQDGRILSSAFKNGSVSEIRINNSPIFANELSEIKRLAKSGATIIYKAPNGAPFFKTLSEGLSKNAKLIKTETFIEKGMNGSEVEYKKVTYKTN